MKLIVNGKVATIPSGGGNSGESKAEKMSIDFITNHNVEYGPTFEFEEDTFLNGISPEVGKQYSGYMTKNGSLAYATGTVTDMITQYGIHIIYFTVESYQDYHVPYIQVPTSSEELILTGNNDGCYWTSLDMSCRFFIVERDSADLEDEIYVNPVTISKYDFIGPDISTFSLNMECYILWMCKNDFPRSYLGKYTITGVNEDEVMLYEQSGHGPISLFNEDFTFLQVTQEELETLQTYTSVNLEISSTDDRNSFGYLKHWKYGSTVRTLLYTLGTDGKPDGKFYPCVFKVYDIEKDEDGSVQTIALGVSSESGKVPETPLFDFVTPSQLNDAIASALNASY